MYHSYTVDEHTLRAVGIIANIAAGRHADEHPLATQILPLIEDKEALFLAMLLHDTGKGGVGGQEKAGARAARQACERMGLERSRIELVAWIVEHHLEMSDYAQKRDVTDPATIAAFARIVETPERLRLLLVLTVADIRAVGPGVWNGWKGQLIRELYGAVDAIFRGGRGGDAAGILRRRHEALAYEARTALVAADPAARAWAVAMEDAYFTAFAAEDHALHAGLALKAAGQDGVAAEARIRPDRNATELSVAAPDRRGLFADLAGAISSLGGNVLGARIFTSRDGQVLDVFSLQDAGGQPFGADSTRTLQRLTEAVEAAACGKPLPFETRKSADPGRSAAFSINPTLVINNDASQDATVIEASGRDRPGLLASLARTMADSGLSIQSAHIDGYGERAVDAFYVQTDDGGKLADAKKSAALRGQLLEVLASAEAKPSRLQRARANAGR
jgi:[protein-PII] uridylyltransferase